MENLIFWKKTQSVPKKKKLINNEINNQGEQIYIEFI